MSKPKLSKGYKFTDLISLIEHLWVGRFWVFIGSRAYHPDFVLNMPVTYLSDRVSRGIIFVAVDETGEPYGE